MSGTPSRGFTLSEEVEMGYVIKVVKTTGTAYLHRGNEVKDPQDATYYPHPSSTEPAIATYKKKHHGKDFVIGRISWKLLYEGEA
jgi:hypothetical protein